MKKSLLLVAAIGLASTGAFAKQPVKMTDTQMDKVTAGALINAVVVDVVDVNNVLNNNKVAVAVPVNAGVAVNVLGGPTGASAIQQPGRIRQ